MLQLCGAADLSVMENNPANVLLDLYSCRRCQNRLFSMFVTIFLQPMQNIAFSRFLLLFFLPRAQFAIL